MSCIATGCRTSWAPFGGRCPASSPQPGVGVLHPGQGAGIAARGRVGNPVLPGAGPTRLSGGEAALPGFLEEFALDPVGVRVPAFTQEQCGLPLGHRVAGRKADRGKSLPLPRR